MASPSFSSKARPPLSAELTPEQRQQHLLISSSFGVRCYKKVGFGAYFTSQFGLSSSGNSRREEVQKSEWIARMSEVEDV